MEDEFKTCQIRILWSTRAKAWDIVGSVDNSTYTVRAAIDAPLDRGHVIMLVRMIQREMESWLPF